MIIMLIFETIEQNSEKFERIRSGVISTQEIMENLHFGSDGIYIHRSGELCQKFANSGKKT